MMVGDNKIVNVNKIVSLNEEENKTGLSVLLAFVNNAPDVENIRHNYRDHEVIIELNDTTGQRRQLIPALIVTTNRHRDWLVQLYEGQPDNCDNAWDALIAWCEHSMLTDECGRTFRPLHVSVRALHAVTDGGPPQAAVTFAEFTGRNTPNQAD